MSDKQQRLNTPVDVGPVQAGWFREGWAHVRRPFVAVRWRIRNRWLADRGGVAVRAWHQPFGTVIIVAAASMLALASGWAAFLWAWNHVGEISKPLRSTSWIFQSPPPLLTTALSFAMTTVIFLAWRMRRIRRYYVRLAKDHPEKLVQTAGPMIDYVVGRDQLCDELMINLVDRRARRPHVIAGSVGVGKTAVLVHLTRRLAKKRAIPVPIRLRDVQTEKDLDFNELAKKRFGQIVAPRVSSQTEQDRAWQWLRRRTGQVVVLADGLEEALMDPTFASQRDTLIRRAIHEAAEQKLPLVIASRPHDPLRAMEAAITELEPLSEEAALDYLQHSGTWRSDQQQLDRVVEATAMVEAPLYLQIARDLHNKDLLEPLWSEVGSGELTEQDRWAFRQDLMSAWLDGLIDGQIKPELPIDRETRAAVIEYISALACIGLAKDRSDVPLSQLEPFVDDSQDLGRQQARSDPNPHQKEWVDKVAQFLGGRMQELRNPPDVRSYSAVPGARLSIESAGIGLTVTTLRSDIDKELRERLRVQPQMNVRLAATLGRQMGLVEERGSLADRDGGIGSGGRDVEASVHFRHSIMQAYLGSRYLKGILTPSVTRRPLMPPQLAAALVTASTVAVFSPSRPAAQEIKTDVDDLLGWALRQGGRELLIALKLHARSMDGQCTHKTPTSDVYCPIDKVCSVLGDQAELVLNEADELEGRVFRTHPEDGAAIDANRTRIESSGGTQQSSLRDGRGEHRQWALEMIGAAIDISSVGRKQHLEELLDRARRNWSRVGLGEVAERLRETKFAMTQECGSAACRVPVERRGGAYKRIFEIAKLEEDERIRAAFAEQIGKGRECSYRALHSSLHDPQPILVDDDRPDAGLDDGQADGDPTIARLQRAQRMRRRRTMERLQRKRSTFETESEWRRWNADALSAWILPMLVETTGMTRHEGSPMDDLEHWVHIATAARAHPDDMRNLPRLASDNTQYGLSLVLAQGFKNVANRRRTPGSSLEGREFLIKQAQYLLRASRYWYTRLTLLQALTLWALPEDVRAPRHIRGPGADPRERVREWLHRDDGKKDHPLVIEAGKLAVRALQTREPTRFLWIDERTVVGQIGTDLGVPAGSPRFHNLWIPPSTGWSSLDPRAQQLLADVVLLLVLGRRDYRPKDLFRVMERTAYGAPRLPSCLSRDRSRLSPVGVVPGDQQPGESCRDDCRLKMCPYPAKTQNRGIEFSAVFCMHQHELLRTWQPHAWMYFRFRRQGAWQRKVPVTGQRLFWRQMGVRARDGTPQDLVAGKRD